MTQIEGFSLSLLEFVNTNTHSTHKLRTDYCIVQYIQTRAASFSLHRLNDCFQAIFMLLPRLLEIRKLFSSSIFFSFFFCIFSVFSFICAMMQQIKHFFVFLFRFDVLVNGGGAVTLQFQRSPFHPMTRTVFVPWNQVNWIEQMKNARNCNYRLECRNIHAGCVFSVFLQTDCRVATNSNAIEWRWRTEQTFN